MAARKRKSVEPPNTRAEAHEANRILHQQDYETVRHLRSVAAERKPLYAMLAVTHEAAMQMIDRLYDPAIADRKPRQLTSEQMDTPNVKKGAG